MNMQTDTDRTNRRMVKYLIVGFMLLGYWAYCADIKGRLQRIEDKLTEMGLKVTDQ